VSATWSCGRGRCRCVLQRWHPKPPWQSALRKRELHLGRDCSNESIQRLSILVVIDVTVPNCFPHVPHLEPYPHHRGPLGVVGLGEGRPLAVGTDVPDNGLDPMVTMVPVRGGRAAPPIKAVISVNPAADASAPVWGTAAAHPRPPGAPPARSRPLGLPPRRPWGCTADHCAACSRAAPLTSLNSLSLSSSAETELPLLLARRALSSTAAARAASATAASTSVLAAASSAIASLAAVAAVSAVARSRSSAAATSASCRCCALETTER
jgi:hypothetical protein